MAPSRRRTGSSPRTACMNSSARSGSTSYSSVTSTGPSSPSSSRAATSMGRGAGRGWTDRAARSGAKRRRLLRADDLSSDLAARVIRGVDVEVEEILLEKLLLIAREGMALLLRIAHGERDQDRSRDAGGGGAVNVGCDLCGGQVGIRDRGAEHLGRRIEGEIADAQSHAHTRRRLLTAVQVRDERAHLRASRHDREEERQGCNRYTSHVTSFL